VGLGIPLDSLARGFAIIENSAKELGQSYAGATTNIEDGSAIYFNFGAIRQMQSRELTLTGHLIPPSSHVENTGSQPTRSWARSP
jgi:long-subunit fatty acid transport protein